MEPYNATHDITEKDLVMYNWHLLKCKDALRKATKKEQPKKKWWEIWN